MNEPVTERFMNPPGASKTIRSYRPARCARATLPPPLVPFPFPFGARGRADRSELTLSHSWGRLPCQMGRDVGLPARYTTYSRSVTDVCDTVTTYSMSVTDVCVLCLCSFVFVCLCKLWVCVFMNRLCSQTFTNAFVCWEIW